MAFDPRYADAISGIESGGRYDLLGPVTKGGDRAYGKYQVMGANIPTWTKQVLGQELTPSEFLASPQAQDAVFNGIFGQYVDKYGPEGAAQAWFAGPGGVGKTERTDILGTSVGSYGKRFMASLGQQPAQPTTTDVAATNVGTSPQQRTNSIPAFNQLPAANAQGLPAFAWSPQPIPNFDVQQATPQLQFQQLPTPGPRPPLDLTRFHQVLAQLQAPYRGFSFTG